MSLTIERGEVDRLAAPRASVARLDEAEAVRTALADALQRREASLADVLERLRPLQERLDAIPSSGVAL